MNIFFYSARQAKCPNGCAYPDCAKRSFWNLRSLPTLAAAQLLPSGSLFPLSPELHLRCGDLIVVHVADHEELELLLANDQSFAPYRLVLIVSDRVYETSQRYHLLNPRYITTTRQAVSYLEPVIRRISEQAASDQTPDRPYDERTH